MGIDPELFLSPIDDELKCPICYRVLEEPLQGFHCDHVFCKECINAWLTNTTRCPMDRMFLSRDLLRPAPKLVKHLLNRLEVRCPNVSLGCFLTVTLETLDGHIAECWYDPRSKNHARIAECRTRNPLAIMRDMAAFSDDIDKIKADIENLRQHYVEEKKHSELISNSLSKYTLYLKDCREKVRTICEPLMKMIATSVSEDESDEEDQEHKTIDVAIHNLHEFTNEGVITEYLRQNDIYVQSCRKEPSISARSLNFVATIKQSQRNRILNSELWPRGVLLNVVGEKASGIQGARNKELPAVVIQAGLNCWANLSFNTN
ncbi:hypothetical protein B4U79_17331 [Dinothrombium tinctorium]|uniref:RING-type domain-containing protein n=1 Tax=Dinothrombium tinctorium TaxID=1965070 RepID=A0A443RF06_9ACAR|nr:hypothetical protein B4U79_17331 [Dinothrombium tinctorium]